MDDMKGGEPPDTPISSLQDQDVNETIRAMGDAMARVARLEHAMRDMIYTDLVAAGASRTGLPIAGNAPRWIRRRAATAIAAIMVGPQRIAELQPEHIGPHLAAAMDAIPGYLSRQTLDRLAQSLNEPPLRDQPDHRRGLCLVGQSGPARPLYLRIELRLRLCLDSNSNAVGIERLTDGDWHPLALRAVKDGMGGVDLDLQALERLAGPLSPTLWRILRQEATPPGTSPQTEQGFDK